MLQNIVRPSSIMYFQVVFNLQIYHIILKSATRNDARIQALGKEVPTTLSQCSKFLLDQNVVLRHGMDI